MFTFRRDPIRFLQATLAQHGDIFRFHVLGMPFIMLNHPDLVQRVLVENAENYDKGSWLYNVVKPVVRNGLIGSVGGDSWRRQRKIMSPPFQPATVPLFASYMTDEIVKMMDRWEKAPGVGGTVDVSADLGELVLTIVTRCLFSTTIDRHIREVQQSFHEANAILADFFRFPFIPLSVPTPRHRRLRQLIRRVDDIADFYVRQRLDAGLQDHQPDLLSMLMKATDDEGRAMSVGQLKDEVLNVAIGAYETTAGAAAWAFYLLARHPEVEERVWSEVREVCGSRTPGYEDIARLTYTRMVIDETLRLYSPAWQTMRRAIQDDSVGGYHIPANSNVYVNNYLFHRHRDLWPRPEEFIPERFTSELVAARAKNVYAPFGAGPRVCLGKHFALMELRLLLATVSQRCRLRLVPGSPPVEPEPLIMLHPKGGVRLILERR
jgi:cytochrome P450